MPVRVAVLDDHQGIALRSGPWASLGAGVEVEAFTDHVAGDAALAERLAPFEVVVAMRERTPFTAARLAALPALRLLVTTGMANPRSTWRPRASAASWSAAPARCRARRRSSPGG